MSENRNDPPAGPPPSISPPPQAVAAPAAAPLPRPRRRALRIILLIAGPLLVLVVGGYIYLTTGRYAGTDNAYVKADRVVISARTAGPIAAIDLIENQHIKAGDVLFVVDDAPYRVALARAEAQVQAVTSMIESVKATYLQQVAQLELARTNVAFTKREFEREQALSARKLGSEVDVEDARHEFDIATRQIPIIEQGLASLRAQLASDPEHHTGDPATHPAVLAAKAARDSAALDLEHTVVRAPFDGIASKVPLLGQYVAPGGPVMSIVAEHDFWIEANYKETDLLYVQVGQPVSIHIDTYPDHEWHGRVDSISQATGAEFSIIPAQNATGNWVKVTQRIPLRIAVDMEAGDPLLRSGMSAEVEIDTGHERRKPAFLSFIGPPPLATKSAAAEIAYRND